MVKLDANLSMMFNEVPFEDRFYSAAKMGFSGVEYLFPYDYKKDDLRMLLKENKLTQVLHNLPAGDWDSGDRGIACDPTKVEEFKKGVELAADYASDLSCPQVNCLTGIKPLNITDEEARETLVSNLKYAAPILKKAGVKLIIESINTNDIPGFFLNNTNQAVSIIKDVNSDNLMLQHDIYHMQIMEGNLAKTIESNLKLISHIQIADNPGRHEPGTGEINYPFLFKWLDKLGYDGWVGCEYIPLSDTELGLKWASKYL